MFNESKDILIWTISVCVAAFTIFACWGMFYIVGGLRNFFKIAQDIRDVFKKIEETIEAVKGKVGQSASYIFLLGEALKKIMEATRAYSDRKKEREDDGGRENDGCREEKVSDIKKGKKVKVK
jgi:hypothetical protein